MVYGGWEKIGDDVWINICQMLDRTELEILHMVNHTFHKLVATEFRVWHNTELPMFDAWRIFDYFQQHPLQRHCGRLEYSLDHYKNQWVQLVQRLDRVHYLYIKAVTVWWWKNESLFKHSAFSMTLKHLKIQVNNDVLGMLTHIEPGHLPALTHLEIVLVASEIGMHEVLAVVSQWTNITTLSLMHLFLPNHSIIIDSALYEPMFEQMQHLEQFECNYLFSAELIHVFTQRMPLCRFKFAWWPQDPEQLSAMDIQFLQRLQQIHQQRPPQSISLIGTSVVSAAVFDTRMLYTAEFTFSVHFTEDSSPETWMLNNWQRWQSLSRCSQLEEVIFECSRPTQFNIHCLRMLRPLYRQLKVFQLSNLILTSADMHALEMEIALMSRLINRDCLIDINWHYPPALYKKISCPTSC